MPLHDDERIRLWRGIARASALSDAELIVRILNSTRSIRCTIGIISDDDGHQHGVRETDQRGHACRHQDRYAGLRVTQHDAKLIFE